MNSFEVLVARYNSTLPTFTNGDGGELQLTSKGILLTTVRDTDGSDVIVKDGDDVSASADRGFIVYGINGSDDAKALSIDASGYLEVNVKAGSISVDFTPGTDKDTGSDEAGGEVEPGVIAGITSTYQTICAINITSGSTMVVSAFDACCDALGQFQLVVGDSGSGVTTYIRTLIIPEAAGSNQIVFPRPREIVSSDADTYIKVIGKSLRANKTMNAAAGINGYFA